jgi:hypothetical protein
VVAIRLALGVRRPGIWRAPHLGVDEGERGETEGGAENWKGHARSSFVSAGLPTKPYHQASRLNATRPGPFAVLHGAGLQHARRAFCEPVGDVDG